MPSINLPPPRPPPAVQLVLAQVPVLSRANVRVRQEGQDHSVSAEIQDPTGGITRWSPHEVEEKTISYKLRTQGAYVLTVRAVFASAKGDVVYVTMSIDDPRGTELRRESVSMLGEAAGVKTVTARISVG